MIEFHQVVRRYGNKTAVAGLDLTIPRGELFAFLGPNGAGKTTTIKMLVGLLRPTSGTIRVAGHALDHDHRTANRVVGYVPDEPYLYEKLTGREFLDFIVQIHGLDRHKAQARIERAIADFELGDFVDNLAESYSHGMRQRLVFSSALLHNPQVLVLDEPMVGLDPRSAKLVKDLLSEMTRQGTTIFMSTHTLGLAEEIAHRLGIIHQGQLQALGTLDELRRQSAAEQSSLEQLFLQITGEPIKSPAKSENAA